MPSPPLPELAFSGEPIARRLISSLLVLWLALPKWPGQAPELLPGHPLASVVALIPCLAVKNPN